ncbi:MAG TPA: sugar ABC transporter permease [candidate division WOR-3 bacterium]|uniref:Sugar ABC transporter permease n=1 Tax=candidate division WOR-3 bacterium TaxID=2052148 RepID=A0A7C5I4Q3_UNCW3|nr:sugar ABC transporter permease [candidate division WOR-3 bacterium]
MKIKKNGEIRTAYFYISPLLTIILLFILIPIVGTFINSLYRDITYLPSRFTGFTNYADLIKLSDFWNSLKFTTLFTAVSVSLETVLGISFALLLKEVFTGRSFLRTILLIPWAIPTAISARLWQLMYNYNYGLLNYFLDVTHTGAKVNWLGTAHGAFWAITIADVWKTTPFMTLILLAGLQTIPDELYEQAMVDNATMWKRFLYITLPLLRPALVVALIFRTADALRIFDLVYVLTGGGPAGSTRTVSILGFHYFVNGDFGTGSAVSIIIFLLVFIFSFLYIRAWRFKETL